METTADAQTERLEYSPLPADAAKPFRLLYLLPGTDQDEIECLLVDSHLAVAIDSDTFEALSYVWGPETPQRSIKLNGVAFSVRMNLYSALYHLRRPDNHRVLWTDAICINQEDRAERASQVGLMRDIYRGADRTVVWLGEAAEGVDRVFKAIRILGDEALGMQAANQTPEPEKGAGYDEVFALKVTYDPVIGENTWWDRVWTLQEIVLGRRPILQMGQEEVDWDFFVTALRHGKALNLASFGTTFFGTRVVCLTDPLEMIESLRKAPELANSGYGFLSCADLAHFRDATDERDKLFGLLGLVTIDTGIKVDYDSPASDVFIKSTRALIEVSGDLDALGFCYPYKIRQLDTPLPSWVPQWASTGTFARPMMKYANGDRRTTNASRGFACTTRWSAGGTVMIAEGFVVDTVKKLAEVLPSHYLNNKKEGSFSYIDTGMEELDNQIEDGTQWSELTRAQLWAAVKILGKMIKVGTDQLLSTVTNVARYIEWEDFIQQETGTPGKNTDASNRIFREILSVGTQYPGGPAETEEKFAKWSKGLWYIRTLKYMKMHRLSTTMFRSTGFLLGLKAEISSENTDFGSVLGHTAERRMGVTRSGRLSLLPKLTEEGDQVVIFKGGRVPLVIRPRGNGYVELIGEAYVQGIMDGEVLSSNMQWSEFFIN